MGCYCHHWLLVMSYQAGESTRRGRVPVRQRFCVFPDGSKENWPESDAEDAKRDAFVRYLNAQAYEDGSNSLQCTRLRRTVHLLLSAARSAGIQMTMIATKEQLHAALAAAERMGPLESRLRCTIGEAM